MYAQHNPSVSGRITDEKGQPIPGATIIIKGTTTGTVSDEQGAYKLNVPPGSVLVVSSIGFTTQEIAVNERANIPVTLSTGSKGLDEVVVVGYGTRKRSDVTGSIVSVSSAALQEVPAANLQQALQGRATGLEIQKVGTTPGAGAQIRIRGERSITGSNDPLIVLDGIPFEGGSINDINPDDVASVDVLKDASATAIYGSRGANGVIIISTKRGKPGETHISYNGYYGITDVTKKYPVYNADEYRALRDISPWNQGYMPEEQESIDKGRSTDWQDLMYEHGFITDHNLGVYGGSANGSTFSLGGGYYRETTVLPGQDFTRYSLRATIDSRIGKRLKIGLNTMNNVGVRNGSQFVNPVFAILALSPLMPAYDNAGNILQSPTGNVDERQSQYNPLYLKHNNNDWADRVRRLRTFNSLYGEYEIIDGLKYRLNLGLDYSQQESDQFQGADSYFRPKRGNTASVNNEDAWGYTVENLLMYDKTFAQKHHITFTGLYSIQESHLHNTSISKDSITEDFIQYYDLNQSSPTAPLSLGGSESSWALISYMARLNYVYDDRYMITLTARRDGSSKLARKWHEYPAVSLGWNITNEPFMKKAPFISALKLRAGWGQTSNQAVNPYTTLGGVSGYITQGTNRVPVRYNYGGTLVTGYVLSSIPDPSLDWEYTKNTNIGLDFGLFDNRITGSVDVYKAHTNKILYAVNLPASSGISGQFVTNVGEMENKGLEVAISTINITSNSGFTWSTDLNIFLNRNKLLKLNEGVTQNIGNQLFVGHPLSAIYDYTKLGIWQQNEAAEAAEYGAVPGQLKLADISGPDGKPDGKIDLNDRSVIGSGQADWQGGITNRFAYKGFDLSVVIYARVGGMLISGIHQPTAAYLTMLDGKRNGLKVDYWTPDNPTNEFPMPSAQMSNPPEAISTLGYYSASFMKVRSINLGYTFSQKIISRLKAQSIRLYVTAQNPFTLFSPYMKAGGVDPEATGTGTTGFVSVPGGNISNRALTIAVTTPPTRAFILGANVNF